ncbi:replication restart helicase PriA [Pseudobdellovibrio exovorus]|uniref:Replication restart protein PriA n=1 Tax=Pseudobdellovibrio exovorus JSS TaxID=1184267 RepID=M4V7E8_9BACT|nr:primosomal protein N' [Pseudobdellovibrio exovorus]AGH94360.1 primosomal replication factor Y [Pseudobdellovibrio exovorus JSS]
MSERLTVRVAVDAPLSESLTYLPHPEFQVRRGDVVSVPLGKRQAQGVVVAVENEDPANVSSFELKPISERIEEFASLSLPEAHLKWLEWMSDYYLHPLGQVTSLCFPPLSKTQKERKSNRPPVIPEVSHRTPHQLNVEQQNCVDSIPLEKGFSTHLVHGVTGSGKTEIYLELFTRTLAAGKKGIFLLPEISLTPQLIQRFAERFGDQIAVLHSQLTDRERTNQWWDIVEDRKSILIGARSALFCPVKNLGLIVVDEEHEGSFKQDEKLKYNGRDCAIMQGHFNNCCVILGSATPSLESWKNALDGKYVLHQIKNRVNNRPLPQIEVIDMRLEKEQEKVDILRPNWLSEKLLNATHAALERKEQVAFLLNRRGMSQLVFCPSCGHSVECPNCDISLTLHANVHLVCHYCDYHENFKTQCPSCKEGELINLGLGTEKVEEDLKRLFPDKVIARADRDEITSRLDMEELVQKMEKSEIDILIGTQMIAKGLDFSNLTLVGLLLADISFNLPDFRATERSFQLITQMSGRSGRHVKADESPGKVVIQTYNTEHDSIRFAQAHDFEGFATQELQNRQQLNYPPFHRVVSLRIQATDLNKVQQTAQQLSLRAQMLKEKFPVFADIEVLGPAAAPIAKLRNQFRYHLLLKSAQSRTLNQFVRKVLGDTKWIPKQAKVVVDIDPLNLL